MSIKDQNLFLFFGSLSCGSMSRASQIGATTLNGLLSPLKNPHVSLFQILNKPYFKPPIKPLDSQKNPYFKPYKTLFQISSRKHYFTSRNQPKYNHSIYDYMRLAVICD